MDCKCGCNFCFCHINCFVHGVPGIFSPPDGQIFLTKGILCKYRKVYHFTDCVELLKLHRPRSKLSQPLQLHSLSDSWDSSGILLLITVSYKKGGQAAAQLYVLPISITCPELNAVMCFFNKKRKYLHRMTDKGVWIILHSLLYNVIQPDASGFAGSAAT